VQKGKFSAGAELLVNTLKNVDLPTFGTPTMPTRKFVPTRPINGFFSGSSTFFGGILKIKLIEKDHCFKKYSSNRLKSIKEVKCREKIIDKRLEIKILSILIGKILC